MTQRRRRALDLPTWLAYLIRPVAPILRRANWPRRGRRAHRPSDILLPQGYVAEVVASELTSPVHCCFDASGACYVTEGGHKTGAAPRIWRVDTATGEKAVHFTLPEERWVESGALTGACWVGDRLVITNTDTVSELRPDGTLNDLVTGLPGRGDHQVNHPLLGDDGWVYFGVGSATNAGVVGPDNFTYGWLADNPTVHDVPAHDVRLVGRNFESHDVAGGLADLAKTVRTGAFVPYRSDTAADQVIAGHTKASGAILRCRPDGSDLNVVAWGLRNPFGIAFDAGGRLFATEHGMDNRGARQIVGDPDDLYGITEGAWYGWPDFASGIRLDDPHWGAKGQGREPVLAEFPDPAPPRPIVSFEPHSGSNGLAFARPSSLGDGFGFAGQAFVALFGDLAPITTVRLATPRGYKVVRVDLEQRRIVDFAINRFQGPASKLPHGGFERPSHVAFGPDGALYVVDWGEIEIAPESAGIKVQRDSGTLWRIRRTGGPAGTEPPAQTRVPFYLGQYTAWLVGGVGGVLGLGWLVRRTLGRRR